MDRHPAPTRRSKDWASWLPPSLRGHAAILYAYVRLEVSRTLRSRQYQLLAIALPIGLLLLDVRVGAGGQRDPALAGADASAYALAAMATLGTLGATLAANGNRLAADRADGWVRTLMLSPMSRFDMLFGRLVAGVVSVGGPILVVITAGALLHGAGSTAGTWLQLVVSLWIGAVPLALLGMVVGLFLRRDAAIAAVLALWLGLAYGGGLLAPLATPPVDIATIGRVLPSFLLDDLVWHELLGQGPSARDIALVAAESLAVGSLIVWNRRSA